MRVEPLYEHVPFAMLQERVQLSVPLDVLLVFETEVHGVVQEQELLDDVPLTAEYPVLHVVEYDVTLQLPYEEHPEQVPPADEHALLVYLPLHVLVPLPVRVPLVILVVVVHEVVLLVFETAEHSVVQLHAFSDFVYPDLQVLKVHEPLPQLPLDVLV